MGNTADKMAGPSIKKRDLLQEGHFARRVFQIGLPGHGRFGLLTYSTDLSIYL
jgi:hypothetical protein